MLPTDLIPDPGSPRFAVIRTRLARAYLEHKTDLGVSVADSEIVYRVDEITILLIHGAGMAMRTNDTRWLERYRWFAEIVDELMDDDARHMATMRPYRSRSFSWQTTDRPAVSACSLVVAKLPAGQPSGHVWHRAHRYPIGDRYCRPA